MKTFYVTTPIYYVNDVPHIGHAYCTVGADALARFKRMEGYDVFFLTGTDEHGQKIEKTAREKKLSPKQLADQVVVRFQEAWEKLDISYDRFIRTTEESHRRAVVHFFKTVQEKGFLRKGIYSGWYSHYEERFLQPSEVRDGKGQDGRPVEWIEEENYFFELSRFQKTIERQLEDRPRFVQPDSRRNELIQNFVKPGLEDVCVTRSGIRWGIPAPVPEESVIYVWFDALLNYLSALDWPDGELYRKFWCGEGATEHHVVHLIGKDILRFHAILWPAMLEAAVLPWPTLVFATGFITQGGQKMSKSLGNVIRPMDLLPLYGSDALRYYLLREIPFGMDGQFTVESFEHRFNSDLANDLGNLAHRFLNMLEKYRQGRIPKRRGEGKLEEAVAQERPKLQELSGLLMGTDEARLPLQFQEVLERIWHLPKRANKYIEESAPWRLAKEGREDRLDSVLWTLAEALRVTALWLAPFLPNAAQKLWEQLGYEDSVHDHRLEEAEHWGNDESLAGRQTKLYGPLFPRIEKEKQNVGG